MIGDRCLRTPIETSIRRIGGSTIQLSPLHHTIIAVDVAGSGSRPDALIMAMRTDLRRILGETLGLQGLSLDRLDVADLGDGFRLHLPATLSPRVALDPFVANLTTALRMHREASSEANRLRLRFVVHSGLLHPEPGGVWAGEPLKACARLLDAPVGRDILTALPAADLVVIVSQTIHDSVVRHGYTVDPALFRRVRIENKETSEDAWAYVPGAGPSWEAPDVPPAAPPTPDRKPRTTGRVTMYDTSGPTYIGDNMSIDNRAMGRGHDAGGHGVH